MTDYDSDILFWSRTLHTADWLDAADRVKADNTTPNHI
jgi:hypothetical protein